MLFQEFLEWLDPGYKIKTGSEIMRLVFQRFLQWIFFSICLYVFSEYTLSNLAKRYSKLSET